MIVTNDPFDLTAEKVAALLLECSTETDVYPEPFVNEHGQILINSTPTEGVLAADIVRDEDDTVARTYRVTVERL